MSPGPLAQHHSCKQLSKLIGLQRPKSKQSLCFGIPHAKMEDQEETEDAVKPVALSQKKSWTVTKWIQARPAIDSG